MLIKRRQLNNIKKGAAPDVVDLSGVSASLQLEIQKAKQEARIIKQEAQDILAEAQRKLKAAEAKAIEIIKSANTEAKGIKERVYKETLSVAKKEALELKNQGKELLRELFYVKHEALMQAHKEIINVALDLAEKIIKYQASVDPEVLKTQVQEAIKKATSEAGRVQVFVNPSDIKTLEASIQEIQKLFPSGIEIIPLVNESVDPGSCIVETKSGQLDATFSTQLKTLVNLTSHLEIKEPEVIVEEVQEIFPKEEEREELQIGEEEYSEPLYGEKIEPVLTEETEEDFYTEEEQKLKEELLGNEPLIELPEKEEDFPFSQEIPPQTEESKILEVPEEITDEIQPAPVQKRKKLDLGNLAGRTKEETEELDEFDFEDDEETFEEENKEKPGLKSILKPKTKELKSEISEIAKEVEDNPEWKDLIQNEEDE